MGNNTLPCEGRETAWTDWSKPSRRVPHNKAPKAKASTNTI